MNEPFIYNPCEDGLPAKAWECLIRNKKFLETIALEAKDEDEKMDTWISIYNKLPQHHPFVVTAVVYCLGHDPLDSSVGNDPNYYPHEYALMTWNYLPGYLKSRLIDDLKPIIPSSFEISPPLNAKIKYHQPGRGNSESAVLNILDKIYKTTEKNNLVSLPKFVWDNKHKQDIIRKISDMLGPPKEKTQRLKPKGSTLGSARDWESFLLYEFWIGVGFDRKQAIDLAAREYHDKPKLLLRHHPDAKAKSEANKRLKQQKPSNDCSTLRKSVENIEHYIDNIFPDLNLSPIHK